MAVNKPTGDGKRIGAVRKRVQVFNPKINRWVKIDSETNKFIDVKSNDTPFKGVTKK